MKKLVYLAALLGVAAGLFAFLPKEGEATGYMMIVGQYDGTKTVYLSTITVDGQKTVEEIKTTGSKINKLADLHQAELTKINKLSREHWQVISATSSSLSATPGAFVVSDMVENVYTLRRQ